MNLSPAEIAAATGAEVLAEGGPGSPARATIDSAATGAGDLFFGLRGKRVDGGEYAGAAIEAGAWGVVVGPAGEFAFCRAWDDKKRTQQWGGLGTCG